MRYCIKNMKMTDALVFSEQLKELESTETVEFNFSGRWKVRPLGMLVIGAMIRKYRSKYADNRFIVSGYGDKSYLGTMGFFKYISPQLEIGKFPGESKGSDNYIPITAIEFNELKEDNYKKLSMVDSYILHIISRINFARSLAELDRNIEAQLNLNASMRQKSFYYAANLQVKK